MGNQPSKDEKRSSRTSTDGPDLSSYPSFSKSDTKESARSSLRTLRTKIPGSGKNDSPRTSTSNLTSPLADRSDGASIKSSASASNGKRSHRGSASSNRPSLDVSRDAGGDGNAVSDEPERPPSPSTSHTLGGGHDDIEEAQRSGEVDNVSDAPPLGLPPPISTAQPKESILMRKKGDSPVRNQDPPSAPERSDSQVEPSALKPSDLDDFITRLLDAAYAGKVTKTLCLKHAEIFSICQAARELFLSQPALVELAPPVKIVGDIHGQYTDLIRMFEMCGFPPNSNFLFLGDYVDRGKQSLETILLLLCYKLKFPENFFLLRGNHECANVTRVYGFYDECKRRCNIKVWKAFIDTFNCLPISAIVAGKIFCVHGGLSPSLSTMDDIRSMQRPTDVPDYGLLNDLLWSDPAEGLEHDWEPNERGVSYCFGKKIIMEFLQKHDFDLVCRAHMVVEDGYEFFNDRILVTVFSAPNVSALPTNVYPRSRLMVDSIAANSTTGERSCRYRASYYVASS